MHKTKYLVELILMHPHSIEWKLVIKSSYQRDLSPDNNNTLEVIPQIITNDADEFLFVSKYVQELGYKELNWNLGCPFLW
jgi:tRNA-dihydrouridine synthase